MNAALRGGRGVSRGRIERLIRRHGIRALAGRRYRPCTFESRHPLPVAPNLMQLTFLAAVPNRVRLAEPKARVATFRTWPPTRAGSTSQLRAATRGDRSCRLDESDGLLLW